MEAPTQNPVQQFVNLVLFVAHNANPATLRVLSAFSGDRFRVFGGEAATKFFAARELMAEENEKIDWFSGPVQDRADYLTKSYVPFLMTGPNHALRRKHIVGRVAEAHARLDDLEALLRQEHDHERALARFLFRHFGRIELSDIELEEHFYFRRWAAPMMLLPKKVRTTVLRRQHERLRAYRLRMLQRMEDAGETIADSLFDVIWFNAGTMGFYPVKAIEALRRQPELQPVVRAEVDLAPDQRTKTRALIHEILRINSRIPSTNYVRHGKVEIALIATAAIDPVRYERPREILLDRDHEDVVAFSGSAKNRGCPAERLAPDIMACVVAQKIRAGELD